MHATVLIAIALTLEGSNVPPPDEPTPLHVFRKQVTSALKADAVATSENDKRLSVRELTRLYQVVQDDQRLRTSKTLKGLRIKVWSRLDRTRRRLRNQLARQGTPYQARTPAEELAGAIVAQLAQVSRASAGPSAFVPSVIVARGGGAANFAAELIEVIEQTISPQVWDVHGGPATIAYFPPVHALVIRATDDVHYEVAHLLTMLRPLRLHLLLYAIAGVVEEVVTSEGMLLQGAIRDQMVSSISLIISQPIATSIMLTRRK